MATDTRDRLFDAARELMASEGLNISMHGVAERAGVTRMTLYRHFGTKSDLVLALTLDKATEVRELVTPLLYGDREHPAERRLVETVVALGSAILATPFLHTLFDRVSVEEVDEMDPDGRILEFLRAMLLPFFEDQADAGRLRADAESCFLWTLRQVLAGLVPLAGVAPTEAFRREQAERFLVPSLFT